MLATGIGAGLAAGGVYWWNDGRYDRWQNEDRRLAASMPGANPDVWIADQQSNDALLHSVQRTDTVGIALAGLSIAAVIAAAVMAVVFER